MVKFGNVLRKIRKEKHFTQKMLADKICSQSVLSRIENNEEIPNIIVMQKLCERLNTSIDYVMNGRDQGNIEEKIEWLELMSYYFHTKQYKSLLDLVQQDYVSEQLHSKESMQRYYYYYGSCLYYLNNDFENAVSYLKKALDLTYNPVKKNVTDMEIQLMSCIGKVLADMDELEEGLLYLEKSIKLFHSIPSARFEYELTKIFYNGASVYIKIGEEKRADELITQGMQWAKKNNSYYYLDNLLLLKGIILENNENIDEATYYVKMATAVQNIAYGYLIDENKPKVV